MIYSPEGLCAIRGCWAPLREQQDRAHPTIPDKSGAAGGTRALGWHLPRMGCSHPLREPQPARGCTKSSSQEAGSLLAAASQDPCTALHKHGKSLFLMFSTHKEILREHQSLRSPERNTDYTRLPTALLAFMPVTLS